MKEYFSSNINLPEKLSEDEFYQLMIRKNNGDYKAREKLIIHNIRSVVYEANNRFGKLNYDKKDIINIGIIGLIKAVNTFDLTKNTSFYCYSIRCIDNEILMFIQKNFKYSNYKVISIEGSYIDDYNICLNDKIFDDVNLAEDFEKEELKENIREIVENLPNKEKKIIEMYFGFNNQKAYNQYELAEILNITQSGVSKSINKILDRIYIELLQRKLIEPKVKKLTNKM